MPIVENKTDLGSMWKKPNQQTAKRPTFEAKASVMIHNCYLFCLNFLYSSCLALGVGLLLNTKFSRYCHKEAIMNIVLMPIRSLDKELSIN